MQIGGVTVNDENPRVVRLSQFPGFEEWVGARTWPMVYRMARTGFLIFLILFAFDAWGDVSQRGWPALLGPEFACRLVALAAIALSIFLMRSSRLKARRAPVSVAVGFVAQVAMVYANMLDIDRFKAVNDTWGHECGDLVIRGVAESILAETRDGDLVGRLGGEEFGVLLPDQGVEDARAVAERLRRRVENLDLHYRGQRIKITVSLGLCIAADSMEKLDSLVRRGDQCLYRAKNGGRNRVEEG